MSGTPDRPAQVHKEPVIPGSTSGAENMQPAQPASAGTHIGGIDQQREPQIGEITRGPKPSRTRPPRQHRAAPQVVDTGRRAAPADRRPKETKGDTARDVNGQDEQAGAKERPANTRARPVRQRGHTGTDAQRSRARPQQVSNEPIQTAQTSTTGGPETSNRETITQQIEKEESSRAAIFFSQRSSEASTPQQTKDKKTTDPAAPLESPLDAIRDRAIRDTYRYHADHPVQVGTTVAIADPAFPLAFEVREIYKTDQAAKVVGRDPVSGDVVTRFLPLSFLFDVNEAMRRATQMAIEAGIEQLLSQAVQADISVTDQSEGTKPIDIVVIDEEPHEQPSEQDGEKPLTGDRGFSGEDPDAPKVASAGAKPPNTPNGGEVIYGEEGGARKPIFKNYKPGERYESSYKTPRSYALFGENDSHLGVDEFGFRVPALGEDEAVAWQEEINARIAPDFQRLAEIGVGAMIGALDTLTPDKNHLASIYQMQLLVDTPQGVIINREIAMATDYVNLLGHDGSQVTPADLYRYGYTLLQVAELASRMQRDVTQIDFDEGSTASGENYKKVKHEIAIPEERRREHAIFGMNTEIVGITYPVLDRGQGFKNTGQLRIYTRYGPEDDPEHSGKRFADIAFGTKRLVDGSALVMVRVDTGRELGEWVEYDSMAKNSFPVVQILDMLSGIAQKNVEIETLEAMLVETDVHATSFGNLSQEAEGPRLTPTEKAQEFGFTTTDISAIVQEISSRFDHQLTEFEIPVLVILDEENARRFSELTASGISFSFDSVSAAAYDRHYKIVFATPDAARQPSAKKHEGTHAVVDALHPELLVVSEQFNQVIKEHLEGKIITQQVDVVGAFAALTLHEGLAMYEELETMTPPSLARLYKIMFLQGPNGKYPGVDPSWIAKHCERINSSIALYKAALAANEPAMAKLYVSQALQTIDQEVDMPESYYLVGYSLVFGIIEQLKKAGVSPEEIALWKKEIARSTPKSIEEFKKPDAWIKRLQKRAPHLVLPVGGEKAIGNRREDGSEQMSLVDLTGMNALLHEEQSFLLPELGTDFMGEVEPVSSAETKRQLDEILNDLNERGMDIVLIVPEYGSDEGVTVEGVEVMPPKDWIRSRVYLRQQLGESRSTLSSVFLPEIGERDENGEIVRTEVEKLLLTDELMADLSANGIEIVHKLPVEVLQDPDGDDPETAQHNLSFTRDLLILRNRSQGEEVTSPTGNPDEGDPERKGEHPWLAIIEEAERRAKEAASRATDQTAQQISQEPGSDDTVDHRLPLQEAEDGETLQTWEQATAFMQVFDGRQPKIKDAEKKKVQRRFVTYLDNEINEMFKNNAGVVRSIGTYGGLELEVPLEGGQYITIYIEKDASIADTRISIQRLDDTGMGREAYTYHFVDDGTVIRSDLGDLTEKNKINRETGESADDRSVPFEQRLQRLIRRIRQDDKNAKFEADMNYNNLPIGMDELEGLIALVKSALPHGEWARRKEEELALIRALGEDRKEKRDNSPEALEAQAAKIESAATRLLASPDWTQTELQFEIPLGSEYRVELKARMSSELLRQKDFRNLQILKYDAEGTRWLDCRLELNPLAEGEIHGIYEEGIITSIVQANPDIDHRVVQLVQDAGKLIASKGKPLDQSLVDQVSQMYSELLMEGAANERVGIWHTLADGAFIGILKSSKDGDQPWKKVDDEPELEVRYRTSERIVTLQKYRDGRYEIHDSDPNVARENKAIYGEHNVVESEGESVIFLDNNQARREAMHEAERAMGLRDLKKESLDLITRALAQAAIERSL